MKMVSIVFNDKMNTWKYYIMIHMEKNTLYSRVYENLVDRRERILSGKVNCIPWGLPRFENEIPGIEKGKYYLITANSKVGRLLPL
jgi:hypothetical protein